MAQRAMAISCVGQFILSGDGPVLCPMVPLGAHDARQGLSATLSEARRGFIAQPLSPQGPLRDWDHAQECNTKRAPRRTQQSAPFLCASPNEEGTQSTRLGGPKCLGGRGGVLGKISVRTRSALPSRAPRAVFPHGRVHPPHEIQCLRTDMGSSSSTATDLNRILDRSTGASYHN